VFVEELVERMRAEHEVFCERHWQVSREDFEKPLLYQVGTGSRWLLR